MPRGTCENCEQQDTFVHASPVAFGRNVFVCVQCLNPHECGLDEIDERAYTRSTSLRFASLDGSR
jgi:hypothetical protein